MCGLWSGAPAASEFSAAQVPSVVAPGEAGRILPRIQSTDLNSYNLQRSSCSRPLDVITSAQFCICFVQMFQVRGNSNGATKSRVAATGATPICLCLPRSRPRLIPVLCSVQIRWR